MRTANIVVAVLLVAGSACGGGEDKADAGVVHDATPQSGTISLMWSIVDTNDAPLACGDVGNTVSVRVIATPTIGGAGQVDAFSCEAGSGTTRAIGAGTYRVTVELRASGANLAPAVMVSSVEVTIGNDTPLAPVTFTVDPSGNFTFRIDTEASGANCDSPPTGGGVSEITIELRDGNGTCMPATFEIAAGAGQPAGSYATTCPAGGPFSVAAGCGVENDQEITVSGVRSGPKSMVITATKGTEACWSRSPQFTVPGNNLTADLGSQLLMLDPVPACDPNAPDAGVLPDASTADAMP